MLDLELLKFYTKKTLPDLLQAAADAFETSGFPYLILKWCPQTASDAAMALNSSSVWNNFHARMGRRGEDLERALIDSIETALSLDRDDVRARQNWKAGQSTTFALVSDAPNPFRLSNIQCDLISDFGYTEWTEFLCLPLCKERDRVLVLEAKTHEPVSQSMHLAAQQIFLVFENVYRGLHAKSLSEGVYPSRNGIPVALSRREVECLQWLAAGKTLGEAATIIGISERTLRFHVANARDRLGVATTIQAVVAASLVYGFHPSDTRRSLYAMSRTPFESLKLKTG